MPRYKDKPKAILILPKKQETEAETKVQRLTLLLNRCCAEGTLTTTLLLGTNDCQYCPVKELCGKVWEGCTEYGKGKDVSYNEAKARLEAVFAQKKEGFK